MKEDLLTATEVLTAQARQVMAGSYKNVDRLFELTDTRRHPPEITELAEAFGMMTVKVEAREMALEETIGDLREKKSALEQSIRAREEFSLIFILFTLFIGLYSFVVAIVSGPAFRMMFGKSIDPIINLLFCACLMTLSAILVRRSGLPLAKFGITLRNAATSLRESLVVTGAIICALLALKYWAIRALPQFQGKPFFNFQAVDGIFFVYFLVAPMQEFIARGVFQSSIHRTLHGRHGRLWAIVTTAVLFGVFHTFYSVLLAATAILSSLLWGWLYMRHETIIGVSLSHLLIGNMLVLLDFWPFLAS